MKLNDILQHLEVVFPLSLQESYDNAGLATGDPEQEISGILLCLDVTEEVLEEALAKGLNLVISHHPVIFQGLKRIIGSGPTERIILKAIRNGQALYSMHTNADNLYTGLNAILVNKLGLVNSSILDPMVGRLRKLVTFVPVAHADAVREALFDAGAGHIGSYDMCSFNTDGSGTFRATESSQPFIGSIDEFHREPEVRIETIFPDFLQERLVKSMLTAHPYEEVAYDIYPLNNAWSQAGAGMVGELESAMNEAEFLTWVKKAMNAQMLRHSNPTGRLIRRVAVCSGSGSFLIRKALSGKADAFVTADLKYHQFFEADGRMLLVDAGHFETEQFATEIFYDVLIKKFPNFAIHFSESSSNPVNYF